MPTSTSEFGDSVGIFSGLFSALAVILALIAVLLQGRELKESTKAQNEQAAALKNTGALRPIPMGKKNWMFCWTELGAEHLGIIPEATVHAH